MGHIDVNRPTTDYWTGSVARATVRTGVALTALQVRQGYVAGT